MLSFFPTPYPDELLYSLINRYHVRSGNLSLKQTLLELLGYIPQQLFNLALPTNLEYLVKHLPVASTHHLDNLIQQHTLYPFYKSFLTDSEAWLLKDRMRKKLGNSIFAIAKIPLLHSEHSRHFLRFCPTCLKQDIEKYGEAYWHRLHQIPGVFICTIHHTILQKSLLPIQEGYLEYYAADLKNCSISIDTANYGKNTVQQLLTIAQEIDWLIHNNFRFKGLQWLRDQYQHFLIEQGFLSIRPSKAFKFHEDKFVDAIFSFYGENCWDLIRPGLAKSAARYFYRCLFACDVEPAVDRVTHILLIKFLLKSLKYFFKL